ncbi:MAG TPA: rhodanese-like domain-containing protein [Euzebyales bacterium]|nr:rhodanese-like domain-containing protein [Euzebyales bacterium]
MFNHVPEVDAAGAAGMIAEGATVLDVRRADEWDAGHAPGAVHIPLDQLVARCGELADGGPVIAVCHSGGRSARATMWLQRQGYDAVNLDGGMVAWARAGGPVVRDDGTAGYVA